MVSGFLKTRQTREARDGHHELCVPRDSGIRKGSFKGSLRAPLRDP